MAASARLSAALNGDRPSADEDSSQLAQMRLLIVDDNPANLELVTRLLQQSGYTNLIGTQDPEGVADLCAAWKPDLMLLDLHMPQLSGYEVMAALTELLHEPESLPVLVLTADVTLDARRRALAMGARDFVNKPIDATELQLRVRNLLQTRKLQQQLQDRNLHLADAVHERTAELDQARRESLIVLATTAEHHDDDTHHHTERVGRTAALIAQALELAEPDVAIIRDAAPLHDIGKVGIPDRILHKPGALTPEERTIMTRHVEIGANILANTRSPVLRAAAEIALNHHERWDGRGYLRGLHTDEIPLSARITAIADVFDALTHGRPYKQAWDIDRALAEIAAQAAHQFDPRIAQAFATLNPDTFLHDPATRAGSI